MKCSICGTPLAFHADRCPTCGCRCRTSYTAPRNAHSDPRSGNAPYDPPNRRSGANGCCCAAAVFVPILLLLLLWLGAGLSVVLDDITVMIPESPLPIETAPYVEIEPAGQDCFSYDGDGLKFHPESWDGSPVLQIPDAVGGQTVTKLAPDCFRDCTELTTILLPDTVSGIGSGAFSGCEKLRGLHIPEGLESIGAEAFDGCIDLEAVYIPSSVSFIAEGCFDDCASLLYIFYGGTFESWDALYDDYINPYTTAICLDGNYYHGAGG